MLRCASFALLITATLLGLGGCESTDNRAIDVLRSTNVDDQARLVALHQLQTSGKQSILSAKPELISLLDHSTPDVQRATEETLTLVGSDVMADLITLIGDPQARPSVLRILRQTNVDGAVIERVASATRNDDYTERLHATEVLGALSVKNASALTQLVQLISDQDPLIQIAAIDEVPGLDPSLRVAAVPELIAVLDDRTLTVREAACVELGAMGTSAIEAKSALQRLTRQHESYLVTLAQIALANITNSDRPKGKTQS